MTEGPRTEAAPDRLVELARPWPTELPPLGPELGEPAERLRRVEREKEAVFRAVEGMREELVSLFQSLIRIPSVNPSPEYESRLARHVAETMRTLGMEVTQIEPLPNRVSNYGVKRGTRGRPTLLIYGHLDTVPAGDESAWTSPPFEGRVENGRIIGRGAKDCKLGVASALGALWAIERAGVELAGDFAIVTPGDEETGGHLGIAKLIEAGVVRADWCIYGEGTPDRLTIGARGFLQVEIVVRGRTTHTARKEGGVNAVVKLARIIPAIDGMTFTGWRPHPIVPGRPVASVNIVRGGFKENVVPDRASIVVDIRFLPGMTVEGVLADLERVLDAQRAADPYLGGLEVEVRPIAVGRPVAISPDEPFVGLLATAVEAVTGTRPRAEGMVASTDARWIVHDAGIPTVNFSMGNHTGHQPDEYVGVEDFIQNVKIYALCALMLLT
ncbi:MAG: M20 family metallopeptidase [Clostridia bacterium]|nr:M20 family metallopeptidase [Clostridia bacterium]